MDDVAVGIARIGGPRRGACGCAATLSGLGAWVAWLDGVREVYAPMAVERWRIEPLSLDDMRDAAQMVQYFCSVADVAGRLDPTE